MMGFSLIIALMWLMFVAYWLFSAIGSKRNVRRKEGLKGIGLRLAIALTVLLLLRLQLAHHFTGYPAQPGLAVGSIGVLLTGGGIALAVWARWHLGKNWGMPMSLKENPELITTGPYRLIRHPIYSGILLAVAGTTLGTSLLWLIPLALFGVYFIYSAVAEEHIMTNQFPGTYAAYKARTKMLIPYIL